MNSCPACNNQGLEPVYSVHNVPVNSCIMLDSLAEAMNYPVANIDLVLCNQCQLIFNKSFDKEYIEYSSRYEDQQCFSETFNEFLRQQVAELIDDYEIRQKNILEIGCGKGDFLRLLCDMGGNNGIGVDPAVIPGRNTHNKIVFYSEPYSDKFSRMNPDLICCRHTLEHISDISEFIRIIRNTFHKNVNARLFFEVPDASRIFNDQCFQDIYYEHCTYFTKESLSYLFEHNGFSIDRIEQVYDKQYLTLVASPDDKHNTSHPGENLSGHNNTHHLDTSEFSVITVKKINQWRNIIHDFQITGKTIVIWGGGSKCVSFFKALHLDTRNSHIHIIDINPYRQGKYLPCIDIPVNSPEILRTVIPDLIVVMNEIYEEEIRKTLDSYSLHTDIISLR